MEWIIPANSNLYNHNEAFNELGFIDWRQKSNIKINVNDIIYIYSSKPIQKITHLAKVTKIDLTPENIVDDSKYWNNINDYKKSLSGNFMRLELLCSINNDRLSLNNLLKNGLNGAPQGPVKVIDRLSKYLFESINTITTSHNNEEDEVNLFEGNKKIVTTNIYERNPLAREKCINKYGYLCQVCGFDFLKTYGDIGKDFIHVHHIKPLHQITKEYIVDPINDLITVCPNCHAMLHRLHEGKYYSVDELKTFIKNNKVI